MVTHLQNYHTALLLGVSLSALAVPSGAYAQTATQAQASHPQTQSQPASSNPAQADASQTQSAQGQPASDAAGVGEIIVTAQRRNERLQDVPIAVSAINSAALQTKGIQTTLDLAQVVPALTFTSAAGGTNVRIRGVGTSNFGPGVENPVAMYVDGVYIASTSGAFFNLANIERVEVLKGPQGTLFGRNATGGLVQIITPDPSDQLQGLARIGYGNYATATGDLYLTGPVAQGVAADLSVHYSHEGRGWGKNIHTGNDVNRINDDFLIRSKIKVQPSDDVKFILAGDYSYLLGSRPVTLQERAGYRGDFDFIYGTSNHGGFYDNDNPIDPRAKITSEGVSLTGSIKTAAGELKSITAYRKTRFNDTFALTRVPQNVLLFHGIPKWDQFSQELQLNGGTGKLKYTAGLYYFWSKDRYDPFMLTFGTDFSPIVFAHSINAFQTFHSFQTTNSASGYAQATYEILPATDLTLGGRYTHETKKVSGTQSLTVVFPTGPVAFVPEGTPFIASGINPELTANNFSYRVSLDHKFTRDIMAYISYNTGFKSGGYNLTTPTNPAFRPEQIKALEAGLKTELFDRHLRLNISAFHYDYTNIQVNNFIISSTFITNGGKAKMDGFDVDAEARIAKGLTLNLAASYVNDRFTDFPNAGYNYVVPGCTPTGNRDTPCKANAAGNRLQLTPTFTGNVGFNYETAISGDTRLGLSGNVYHSSGWFGTFDNDPRAHAPAYELVNGSVYIEPSTGLRITVWADNIFGVKYFNNLYVSSQQPTYQAGAPRTYGVTLQKRF